MILRVTGHRIDSGKSENLHWTSSGCQEFYIRYTTCNLTATVRNPHNEFRFTDTKKQLPVACFLFSLQMNHIQYLRGRGHSAGTRWPRVITSSKTGSNIVLDRHSNQASHSAFVMVHVKHQLDWVKRCPDSQYNMISGCVWVCFQKRQVFESLELSKEKPLSPGWEGIIHSFEGLRRTKRWRKWTSLVVQRLGARLPVQGTWVQSLVWEDSTCRAATKPECHNYWACTRKPRNHNYRSQAPRACAPQQEKPHNEKPTHLR